MRLGLLAIVPLMCLLALGAQPLLDAREAFDHSGELPSLITRDVAVEDLRVQLAFEGALTGALVNTREQPVRGLDERSIEQTTGVSLSSSLVAVRALVNEGLVATHIAEDSSPVVEEVNAAKALGDLGEVRRRVDAGQVTRDEVNQYFERADAAIHDLGHSLLSQAKEHARIAGVDSLAGGLDAWTNYLDVLHFRIDEMSGLFAFLAPDARWQTATSRYEFAVSLSGFARSVDALEASLPEPLQTNWTQVRQSPESTDLRAHQAELLSIAGLGPPSDAPAIDGPTRAKLLREASGVVRQTDDFRPVLSQFLLQGAESARSQARDDLVFAAGLMAAALASSVLVLLSTNRAIVLPLRRLEKALRALRGGTRDVPSVELRGPAEIAAAGHAFRDLVDEVRLVEAQAAAIGAGDLLNPILAQAAEMPIGHSLQQSVRTLSSMSAQLKSREETAKAVLETAADAIWTIDGDALIRSANRATEDLLGWPASEVVGAHFGSLLATEADMVVFELLAPARFGAQRSATASARTERRYLQWCRRRSPISRAI